VFWVTGAVGVGFLRVGRGDGGREEKYLVFTASFLDKGGRTRCISARGMALVKGLIFYHVFLGSVA
jgi:hypothetical protein